MEQLYHEKVNWKKNEKYYTPFMTKFCAYYLIIYILNICIFKSFSSKPDTKIELLNTYYAHIFRYSFSRNELGNLGKVRCYICRNCKHN